MTKLLLIITLFFSLTLMAAPVSNEELKSVNDYITERSKSDSPIENLKIEITKADREVTTNLLNQMTTEISYLKLAKAALNLQFTNNINMVVNGSVLIKDLIDSFGSDDISDEDYNEIIEDLKIQLIEMKEKIDEIAKTDKDLTVATQIDEVSSGFGFTLAILPKKENKVAEFTAMSLTMYYEYEKKELKFGVGFTGKDGVENLNLARKSLSNIFSSLASKQDPTEEDSNNLGDALSKSYEKVSDQLEKYLSELF